MLHKVCVRGSLDKMAFPPAPSVRISMLPKSHSLGLRALDEAGIEVRCC